MKIIASAALALAVACQPVMAESKIPADIQKEPAKFCLLVGVMASFIMERRNLGESMESLYADAAKIEHPQLRAFVIDSVSRSLRYPAMTKGTAFGEDEYQSCVRSFTR